MAPDREAWADFIRQRGKRLAYASGAVAWETSGLPQGEVAEFLGRLKEAEAETRLLARLYHLAREPTQAFFDERLRDLTRSATHVSAGRPEVSRKGAKGKINWPSTLRSRLAGKLDRAALVVRKPETSSDVPENRLLKLYLHNVSGAVGYLTSRLGSRAVPLQVRELGRFADRGLKEPFVRDVLLEQKTSARMRQRARRNRNRGYRELLHRQDEFAEATIEQKWVTILKLLADGWLTPIADDDLFELFALVVVLDVLEVDLGFDAAAVYGLIRPDRREIAVFEKGGTRVRVFFDQSPATVLEPGMSEYVDILKAYDGLPPGATPRPDILILFDAPTGQRRLIVEVKETRDDRYMRGSVYKVLGYLRDFREMWAGEMADQRPKALLLFPGELCPHDDSDADERELVLASAQDRSRIRDILRLLLHS